MTTTGEAHASPQARRRRPVTAVVAAVLLAAGTMTAVNASPAAAATVDPSAWYVLVNRNSGKALDVYGLATNDGGRIAQWSRNDGANQQWQFLDSGDGYYRVKSRHSGKVLDVPNSSTADGAAIQQWTDHGEGARRLRQHPSVPVDLRVPLAWRHDERRVVGWFQWDGLVVLRDAGAVEQQRDPGGPAGFGQRLGELRW
ncbi:RICIN domain-containing protein [Saccharothrix sp. NRRL B-16314]|uniref:RICIN domain-containing protein n=1 Tax=Saccharothrix sp. NRRL B-16314 TaxID=1463825 RepID=UPI000A7CA29B